MLPGQIKPLVWSVNIPMVNGTWIQLLSEITGPLDIKPEDLATPFYYQTYFNIAELGRIFSEFGMSADSLENLMLGNDNTKPSFKPGLKTLRHFFRIIRFLNSKLNFESTFMKEYNALRINYTRIVELLNKQVTFHSYPHIFSMLFDEGKKLAYLNIVTPMLMSLYHKRLKKKMAKINIDYDNLDFWQDFPQLISYTPLPAIQRIKKQIDNLPEHLRTQFVSLEKLRSITGVENISTEIDAFINDFGHLSESGNDFSFPKWEENPEMVFNMIIKSSPDENRATLYSLNEIAHNGLKIRPSLRRAYKKAGNYKVYREQISSLYIYGYGLFRKLFLQLGKDLTGRGIIDSENDIFYLTKDEIDAIQVNPDSSHMDQCRTLIQKRKDEMEEMKNIVLPQVIYGDKAPILERSNVKNRFGIGTSSGSYSGKTRVITRKDDFDEVQKGDVLVIPFSDVSWTIILIKAGAIVSESGGMLSHSSIIAREMGIPAIVSVENACTVGNGFYVTVDGSNGILTIHDNE